MITDNFATNILAKKIATIREIRNSVEYDRLILAVLVKYRPMFIKVLDSMVSQLGTKSQPCAVNFQFTHNISPKQENDYSEIEILYPSEYIGLINQCIDNAVKMAKL